MRANFFELAPKELVQEAFFAWLLEWVDNNYSQHDPQLNETAKDFVRLLLRQEPDYPINKVKVIKGINIFWAEINDEFVIFIDLKSNRAHKNKLSAQFQLESCYQITKYYYYKDKNKKLIFIYLKTGKESEERLKKIEEKGYSIVEMKDVLHVLKKRKITNEIFNYFKEIFDAIDGLVNKEKEIEKLVEEKYVDTEDPDNRQPMTDGVIDPLRYLTVKHKILWILKEPRDVIKDGKPIGGGWDLKEAIRVSKIEDFGETRKTFDQMIYASYGILNNFCVWDDIEYVEKDPSVLDALKSTAFINIQKLPGLPQSDDDEIIEAFRQQKDILQKQIDTYNPDIIIIGGGEKYRCILEELVGTQDIKENGNLSYAEKDSKLFIHAHHPSAYRFGWITPKEGEKPEETYVNEIINTVKLWAERQKNANNKSL